MSAAQIEVPPGTEIYGMAYADASAGAWNRDRAEVTATIERAREIGLTPMLLIRLRMKAETLWADQ